MNRPPTPQPHEPTGTGAPTVPGPLPSGPSLAITSHAGQGHTVVVVGGSIDYHTSPQLLGHLMTKELQGVPLVVLDLSRVAFCDSSGLGVFVEVFRRRSETGHRFALAAVQPEVRRVMELTHLVDILPLHATVSDALAEG
ncbi:MAG TPA: STAS domain-containing protein [Streptomyces sp.]|uniref:STAS domain-containing protein n=1 Tax=Streptomyces sp. TaxID=1931 RepID=UPI002D66661E|nr:STAS domain-containing protein [Streptomyces sp.]HZG06710.1 STAS domain-containing protein [Streptomyces sp.]